MYSLVNGRNPRGKTQMYSPMQHQFGNYCTEVLKKTEMKLDYENEIFLNNLHLIPDPLMKNLADTLVTSEKPEKVEKKSLEAPIMVEQPQEDRSESTLAGITSFFASVYNMFSGAVFRTRSQVHYYDCFEEARQGSQNWRGANDGQDKNGKVLNDLSSNVSIPNDVPSDMNNCKAISSCEEKLNQVKYLLSPNQPSNPVWSRKRPKRVFVEPGLIEENFQDAISPEDFVALSNEQFIKCYSPPQLSPPELCQSEALKTKIEVAPVVETTEIVSETMENKSDQEDSSEDKHQLVSSCEDKLSKLKALLKEKRTKHTNIIPPSKPVTEQPQPAKTIPIVKPVDKHYKNPCRMLDKRRKMKMKQSIQDEVIFANEIDFDSPVNSLTSTINSSSDTSLGDYFDELKGRFRTVSTTESEDSFQIVFNDSPKTRRASDCESEDSFIVFEDDNCYTSNDVFGVSDESDSESDVSDSGCSTMTCKLSHSLSRTVSNLTDDTLYESSDEVDCAKVEPVEARGLLVDAARKNLKKDQPAKQVRFSSEPPTVKVMRVWTFAARQARAGHWERYALDRERFKRRIADVDMAVSWVLKPQHRARVMFQRFMPLWNKQKRQELAEKKEKEAEEKRVKEAERERIEEEKRAEEDEKRVKEENLFLLFESLRNIKKNGKVKKTRDINKIKSDGKGQITKNMSSDNVANIKSNDTKLESPANVNNKEAKLVGTETNSEDIFSENVANVMKGNETKLESPANVNNKDAKLVGTETNSEDIFSENVANVMKGNDTKFNSTETNSEEKSFSKVANIIIDNDAKLKSTETNNNNIKTQTNGKELKSVKSIYEDDIIT